MTGELTGRKVLVIALALFGVVLASNITLAVLATRTFSGLVVPNSYVASQNFDARRDAQNALGWHVAIATEGGVLRLEMSDTEGRMLRPARLALTLGRPTTTRDDRVLDLLETPTGYAAKLPPGAGAWRLEIAAEAADGTVFSQVRDLNTGPGG